MYFLGLRFYAAIHEEDEDDLNEVVQILEDAASKFLTANPALATEMYYKEIRKIIDNQNKDVHAPFWTFALNYPPTYTFNAPTCDDIGNQQMGRQLNMSNYDDIKVIETPGKLDIVCSIDPNHIQTVEAFEIDVNSLLSGWTFGLLPHLPDIPDIIANGTSEVPVEKFHVIKSNMLINGISRNSKSTHYKNEKFGYLNNSAGSPGNDHGCWQLICVWQSFL